MLAWLLIYVLEQRPVERLVIQGLDADGIQRVSTEYNAALRELGCKVLDEDRKVRKGSVAITFRSPAKLDRKHIDARLAELPGAATDTVRWESA